MMTFTNANPVVANPIPDMIINTYEQFYYKIPLNAFTDADNNKLTLSASI